MFDEIERIGTVEPGHSTLVGRVTLTQRLEGQKAELEARLSKINEALNALKANPELQKLFDIVSKVY